MPDYTPRVLRSSIAVLLLPLLLPGQAPTEPWRVLRAMEVVGPATFDRDTIAGALAADDTTRQALRRPLDAETAAVVAERVRELHLRAGFGAAQATGEVVDGVLRITLAAGKRIRSGGVKCTGSTVVATERLRDLLAAIGPKPQSWGLRQGRFDDRWKPTWVEGEFPTLDAKLAQRIEAVVLAAYQDVGRHGVRAKVEFPTVGDRIELHIVVEDEGREVAIASLALAGEDEAQRGPVLAAVHFTPGTLATSAALADLKRQFETTGRYLNVQLDLPTEVPAKLDPLTIAVTARPGAPAFGTVPMRDAAQLQLAIDRVQAQIAAGAMLRFGIRNKESIPIGRFQILPGEVSFLLGSSGLVLAIEALQWGEAPAVPAAVQVTPQDLTFRHGDRCGRWRFDEALGLETHVTTNFLPTGEAELRWGVGVSQKAGEFFAAHIHPATVVHVLAKADEFGRNGDELMIRGRGTTVRIAADGSIVGQRVTIDNDDNQVTIAVSAAPDADELRRLFPGAGKAGPASTVLLESAGIVLGDFYAAPTGTDPRMEALLRGFLAAAAAVPASLPAAEPAEQPPSLGGTAAPSFESMIGKAVLRLAVDRRWQGPIVDLGAGFGSLLLRDTGAANARFRAMLKGEDHGPLVLATAAALHRLLGNDRGAASFRERATERWTFDAVYREAAQIGANLESLRPLPAHVGARWRARPELQELFATLPPGEAGDLAAWRQGLERIWAAGLGASVRASLLDK